MFIEMKNDLSLGYFNLKNAIEVKEKLNAIKEKMPVRFMEV